MIVYEEGSNVWRWQRPNTAEVNVFIGPTIEAAIEHICEALK